MISIEFIDPNDSLGLHEYDEAIRPEPSGYGDPEEVMLALEHRMTRAEIVTILARENRTSELRAMCSCLHDDDRLILASRHEGTSQTALAQYLGMSQVGVLGREQRVRVWAREAFPVRAVLRRAVIPPVWDRYPHRERVWDAVVWEHRTTMELEAIEGVSQSAAYGWWVHAVQDMREANTGPVLDAINHVAGNMARWHRPSKNRANRRSIERGIGGAMPDLCAYEMEFEMALWQLDHPEWVPPPKPEPKTDPRTRACGSGIDLSRKDVVREVAKLFYRFGKTWCLCEGVDPEDGLAQVNQDIETRNQGTCPFDPEKGAFSTYVTRIVRQSVHRSVSKHRRRGKLCGTIVTIDAVGFEIGDRPSWTEEEYTAAEARVMDVIGRHAGAEGLRYARAKLGLDTSESNQLHDLVPAHAATRVRRHLPEILAELA